MAQALLQDPMTPQIYRVGDVRRELADTVTLELHPEAQQRPDYEPGQFNMLYAFGVGEVAISISGDPDQPGPFIHTLRDVGATSHALSRLESGAMLGLRGPFGTSWPVAEAEGLDVVIVAGGLGLAPLRPAIYRILANRSRYGHVSLLCGSRSSDNLLYRHQLEEWRRRLDFDIEVTLDHADAGWFGHVGVVPRLIPRAVYDPKQTIALVCGPEIMMRFSVNALMQAGVPTDRIYLSMERNMKCAVGLCGHCQFGPTFVCKDGPVMRYDRIAAIFETQEI